MEKETKFCSTVDVCLAGKKNNEKRKNEVCIEREKKGLEWHSDFVTPRLCPHAETSRGKERNFAAT